MPYLDSCPGINSVNPSKGGMPARSWGLIAVATAVGALSALWVAIVPAGDQTFLVGRSWSEFAAGDPEVASIVARLLVVLGLLGAGFAGLAFLVAIGPYRRAERWAWNVLWLIAVVYGGVAARMLLDGYPIAYWYLALAVLVAAALLLGRSSVRGLSRQ